MMARLQAWWRAHGWFGLSPYVDGPPPDRGPQERDLARVRVLEARVEALRLAARREWAEVERRAGEPRGQEGGRG